jgi:hypothetical protein
MSSSCVQKSKHYVGDTGTKILVEVGENISNALELVLRIKKPDGSTDNWTGTVQGLTKIQYDTKAGDWNIPGEYKLQSYVRLSNWSGLGNTTTFTVNAAWT